MRSTIKDRKREIAIAQDMTEKRPNGRPAYVCLLEKRCGNCGSIKQLSDYRRTPSKFDGRETVCKVCERPRRAGRGWSGIRTPEQRRALEARLRLDANFLLNKRMRNSIRKALAGGKSGRRWESLVGYSLANLVTHLESRFLQGMSWSNIGKWHIDHRKPKSLFDASQIRECWALSNLQPLWAIDNLRKGSRLAA
jgi:hypothetical protein